MNARLPLFFLSSLFLTSYAHAAPVEFQGAIGGGANASTWRTDYGGYLPLRLGFRLQDLLSIDAQTRLGYATVDDRVLTYLSLGVTLYGRIRKVRPFVRVAAVHQHEESRVVIDQDKFGALLGVGDGIRHRGGGAASLGLDLPVQTQKWGDLFVGGDTSATYFPDPRGPALYLAVGFWLGANVRL